MKKNTMTPEEIQQAIQQCEQCLINLKQQWDVEKPVKTGWLSVSSDYLLKGTIFILNSIHWHLETHWPV